MVYSPALPGVCRHDDWGKGEHILQRWHDLLSMHPGAQEEMRTAIENPRGDEKFHR
jgi:hypothetical protein